MRHGTILAAALLAAAITPLVFTGPALAQATPLEKAFAEADVNKDGGVNVDEFVGYVVRVFGGLDKNRDGKVAFADVPNGDRARFDRADRDGDGMVSVGEAVAERMILFFDLDTSRDGVISFQELTTYEQAR